MGRLEFKGKKSAKRAREFVNTGTYNGSNDFTAVEYEIRREIPNKLRS